MENEQDAFEVRLRDAKLAALAEFAAGAGHEINNPVATIVGRAQQLLRDENDQGRRQALATIIGQAFRIRDMIGDLMLFARPPEPHPTWFEIQPSIREAVEPFRDSLKERNMTLTIEGEETTLFADPLQFQVAISELVKNALAAAKEGGKISINVNRSDQGCTVTVIDDGNGFGEMDLEHAFDPFYSGRQAGRGLGFGLSKVWRIATLAGGTVRISSKPHVTEIQILIPSLTPQ